MRLVFAGTPEFAAAALAALHGAGHDIVLVLTQPDRPAGRGLQTHVSAVKKLAETLGARVAQPRTLKDVDAVGQLKALQPDAMVVAAYGLILPPAVLAIPSRGCINIHASLLPRWRGAAPIQRALLAGDAETGVCIMQMEAGLDTGPVLAEERVAITYFGVFLFTGLTAFDTQRLKMIAYQVSADAALTARYSIVGALTLYVDFINLFLYLLQLLAETQRRN